MIGINNNGNAYRLDFSTRYKASGSNQVSPGTGQRLTPPSVVTMGALGFGADDLGRQYSMNYDEASTAENPIVLIKGTDEYGKSFEEKISVNDVNPYNATYLEMAALGAHLKMDGCTPTALSSGSNSYFEKTNYVEDFNQCISDLYKSGANKEALTETVRLRKYLDYYTSIQCRTTK